MPRSFNKLLSVLTSLSLRQSLLSNIAKYILSDIVHYSRTKCSFYLSFHTSVPLKFRPWQVWFLASESSSKLIEVRDALVEPDTVNTYIVSDLSIKTSWIEVYDLGTTHYISLYQEDFDFLVYILPQKLCAVNKISFNATGAEELTIDVPAGYILVSIGRLDKKGFLTTFSNGTCTIIMDCTRLII